MKLKEQGIYSNGKTFRKVLGMDEDTVSYTQCYITDKGFHVIGGGTFYKVIGRKTFRQWAKQEVIM